MMKLIFLTLFKKNHLNLVAIYAQTRLLSWRKETQCQTPKLKETIETGKIKSIYIKNQKQERQSSLCNSTHLEMARKRKAIQFSYHFSKMEHFLP